jgi:RNA polymerase sigma factor (sigma-70 family)
MPDSSDDALMQSVARNEGDAFRTLMQRHRSWVFSLLVAIVRNQQDAEDLTQEVFWRARQHAGKYISQGEFASWLKRIAINAATDFLRKKKKFIALGLEDIESSPRRETVRGFRRPAPDVSPCTPSKTAARRYGNDGQTLRRGC